MKPPHHPSVKRKAGMTLLELTVVILVLLALISILFMGARVWKRSSDRSANIFNIRNVQQAVRSHANVHALAIGAPLPEADIIGVGKYLTTVLPPNSDITYAYYGSVPPTGSLYLSATYAGGSAIDYAPSPALTSEW